MSNIEQLAFLKSVTVEGKTEQAIELLKEFEESAIYRNPLGYVVGYSGGKDSDVLLDIFKRSGVRFFVIHNHTTIDIPDTVYYIRKKFYELECAGIPCKIYSPRVSFWRLCKQKKSLPLRKARFCCSELKERDEASELQFATRSYGVRRTESVKRAKFRNSIEMHDDKGFSGNQTFHFDDTENVKSTGACYTKNHFIINPLAYWSEDNIWEYIHGINLEYNPLYDRGYKRVGCIGCPLAGKNREIEFNDYPKYKALYIRLCNEILDIRKAQGLPNKLGFKCGQEYFEHWLKK